MVSDDACTAFVELLKRILDIINDIEKDKLKGKEIRGKAIPKIKVGKLSKAEFNKLQKAGSEFKFVSVPANNLDEVEKNVVKMGGSYE